MKTFAVPNLNTVKKLTLCLCKSHPSKYNFYINSQFIIIRMPLFSTGFCHSQEILFYTLIDTEVYIYTYSSKMEGIHCLENHFIIQT